MSVAITDANDALPRGRTKALILAAGAGTRLKPLTDRLPKCLVPVAGRPLLEYWIEALGRIGIRDILVNTHSHAEQVHEFLRRLGAHGGGMRLGTCYEPELLGSAGTISANRAFADDADDLFIVYADNFSLLDLRVMLTGHRARRR